jgi:hypothetical protein
LPRFGSRVAVCGGAINLYRRHLISSVGLRVILSVARSLERSAVVWGFGDKPHNYPEFRQRSVGDDDSN